MIKGRNPGDNIAIMNTMFKRGQDPNDLKFHDYFTIVYKDCDTGQKYSEEIVDPDYEYYIAKEDKRVAYNRLFIEKENVDKFNVVYKDLEKDIASKVGMKKFFYENLSNGNRNENRKIHLHPDVFNSDMNLEDHYRFRFDKMYKNENYPITKSFFDIETDTINMAGSFPELGECPINAISLIIQETKQVYVFLLRTKTNPQIQEFENSVRDGSIFPELEAFVVDAVGGPEIADKYNVHFKYNFLFYDEEDEINLIKDLFNAFNSYKPDFALAWNMSFDIPYIIERIKRLGYTPEEIMCNPDFKYKFAYYYVDERMKSEFAERGDFAAISSYTTFLDQMIQFASRRKGQTKLISFSLDYIGGAIAKVKKLDYKDITSNISDLPYKSYKTFVFYNIMDTIVQYCIEHVVSDIEYVYGKSLLNNTRYSKVHRQTVYLTNRGIKEFYQLGFIMGNNVNKYNQKPEEKFSGAFVADPKQINDYSRVRINGRAVNIFNNLMDQDYSSLYPSLIRQFFIAPNTQIGLIIIPQAVYKNENICRLDNWTRSMAFMEDFQSQVWLEICHRWFHLADYTTLYREVREFFTTKMNPTNGLTLYNRDGLVEPMIFYNPNLVSEAMIFDDNRPKVNEIYVEPNLQKWGEWRNAAIANPNQHF